MSWYSPSATPRTTGLLQKIELEPTVVNGRVRLGMHGVDPSKIVTVDTCPLFDKRFPKALKSVVGALNYLSGSHDLGLERVGIRACAAPRRFEVALWTPTGSFPRLAGLPACWQTPHTPRASCA